MTVLTGPEVFSCEAGTVIRAEVQVADEDGGFWLIWDLDGQELGTILDYGPEGWIHCSGGSGQSLERTRKRHETFEAALVARLGAIRASGGTQSDELYWEGSGLPRLKGPVQP